MDLTGRTIWQQAAGDRNRNYARLCLKWDVILNGPGKFGPWPDCKDALRRSRSGRKITDLQRFYEGMKEGHLVVLRLGTSRVMGVGEVVGPYEHHEAFGDVDGWDLQHVRRVRWLWASPEEPTDFDTYALKLGDTTQRLDSEPVEEWLRTLDIPDEAWERPLRELPQQPVDLDVTVQGISEFLFDRGVGSAAINTLVDQIGELIRIAKWYRKTDKPSEHETVAYLVVPLLRALGWPPQRMAVEWKRLDVALFSRMPRSDANVCAVVEAKKMDQSCLTALSQASRYADDKDGCDRLVVTDGIRYGVYVGDGDANALPHAYLNLSRLRSEYPIYECWGAQEALFAMAPDWDPSAAMDDIND